MAYKIAATLSISVAALLVCRTELCRADNPIIQTKYTADPAPLVYGDTLYLYTSHDEDNATGFTMYNYLLYSTTDMVNWTDHGILAGVKDPYKTFKWADGNNAWAPQVIFRNNKFYMYAPMPKGGRMVIGVASASSPTGPFVDAIGAPLIDDATSGGLDIDPTVFIGADGQAYLYFGHQPYFYYVKLNSDMVSYSGSIVRYNKIGTFEEGPWLWSVDTKWYLGWASTCCPEGIGYAMSDNPAGPWTYKGSIMDGDSRSSGNHPGIVQYKGTWYVFGFNYSISYPQSWTQPLPGGHTEQRSVCVEKLAYAADGTIPKLPWWTTTGAPQIGNLNPFVQTQAETIAFSKGLKTEACSEGGMDVTAIENGDYIKVKGVDFGAGATSLDVRVASSTTGGNIDVHLDSQTGKLVGSCAVSGTGGAQTWVTKSCVISGASSVHDLFFVFTGGTGSLFNFNWWQFHGDSGADAGVSTGGATSTGGRSATGGTSTSSGGSASGGRSGNSGGMSTNPTASGGANTGGRTMTGGATSVGVTSGGTSDVGGTTAIASSNSGGVASVASSSTAKPASGGAPLASGGASSALGSTGDYAGNSALTSTSGTVSNVAGNPGNGCGCAVPGKRPGSHAWLWSLASLLGIFRAQRRVNVNRRKVHEWPCARSDASAESLRR